MIGGPPFCDGKHERSVLILGRNLISVAIKCGITGLLIMGLMYPRHVELIEVANGY